MLSALKEIGQDGSQLRVCYESGPYGFVIYRYLMEVSVDCMVISPSSMPRRPNDRVKTGRMDAQTLAVLDSRTRRYARHRTGVVHATSSNRKPHSHLFTDGRPPRPPSDSTSLVPCRGTGHDSNSDIKFDCFQIAIRLHFNCFLKGKQIAFGKQSSYQACLILVGDKPCQ